MNKEKKISKLAVVKEIMKNPRGKALVFFGFYFIFFLMIALISRLGNNNRVSPPDFDRNMGLSIDMIEKHNYDFTYSITIDNNTIIYSGSRDMLEELFNYNDTINNVNYYRSENAYYMKLNDSWIKAEDPYLYKLFLSSEIYSKLKNSFTYVSKTSYQDGRESYNYQISTTSIVKNLENIDIDLDDLANEFIVSSDSSGNINKIEMNLSSYGIFKGICSREFKVVLAYSNFGGAKIIIPFN